MIILLLIVYVIISLFIAVEFQEVAEMKGFHESKYFWIPFLFSIWGYMLIIALPDRNQREPQAAIAAESNTLLQQTASFESDDLPDL